MSRLKSHVLALAFVSALAPKGAAAAWPVDATDPVLGSAGTERAFQELAAIEAEADVVAALPATTDPLVLGEKVRAGLESLRGRARHASSPAIARHAAVVTLRTLRATAPGPELLIWSREFRVDFFRDCGGFSECGGLIKDLAELSDLDPAGVVETITADLRPRIEHLTERVSVRFNNSILQRLLAYRLGSLELLARFNLRTGIHDPSRYGRRPNLSDASFRELERRIQELHAEFTGLLPSPKSEFESEAAFHQREESEYANLTALAIQDLIEFEKIPADQTEVAALLAADLLRSVARTRLGEDLMALYGSRLMAPGNAWLTSARVAVEKGTMPAERVAFMILRFASPNCVCPVGASG